MRSIIEHCDYIEREINRQSLKEAQSAIHELLDMTTRMLKHEYLNQKEEHQKTISEMRKNSNISRKEFENEYNNLKKAMEQEKKDFQSYQNELLIDEEITNLNELVRTLENASREISNCVTSINDITQNLIKITRTKTENNANS